MTAVPEIARGRYRSYPLSEDSECRWLGDIPEHWAVRRLRYVASVRPSSVDKHVIDAEREVRLCNYTDVYKNDVLTTAFSFSTGTATEDEIRRFRLVAGDVVITKDSESWRDIAVPAFIADCRSDLVCGYHLSIVRPHAVWLDGKYLFYALASGAVQEQMHVEATGVTRFGLARNEIGNARIPLPPLPEQRAIAAFLDRETAKIDTLIAKKERLIELLQEQRAAAITRAVTKGGDPKAPMKDSGVQWLGQVPAHWEVLRFPFVVELREGPGIMAVDFRESGIPLLRVANLGNGAVTLEGCSFLDPEMVEARWARFRVREGDRLISGSASTGLAAIVGGDCSGAVPYTGIIRLRPRGRLTAPFLSLITQSGAFVQQVDSLKSGVAIQHFGPSHLRRVWVAIPPTDEQLEIAAEVNAELKAIDRLMANCSSAIDRLREYRTALLSAAVTGKIDARREVE